MKPIVFSITEVAELGWYGIALQEITYYDERGHLRRGNETGVGLYHSMLGKDYYL